MTPFVNAVLTYVVQTSKAIAYLPYLSSHSIPHQINCGGTSPGYTYTHARTQVETTQKARAGYYEG
jgi:hypothetical protein